MRSAVNRIELTHRLLRDLECTEAVGTIIASRYTAFYTTCADVTVRQALGERNGEGDARCCDRVAHMPLRPDRRVFGIDED